MRIVLFSDTYLPTVNGVARTLGRLVEEAVARGHEVALVTPRVSEGPAEGVPLHLRLPGLPIPMYPELLLSRPLVRHEGKALDRFEPDLVHVATEATVGWSGRRWALRRGLPLVTSFHTNFAEYASEYRLGALEGGVWRYLRSFHEPARISFCPSQPTRRLLADRGFHPRWRIWSRGVDTEAFDPSRRTPEARAELAPGAETILLYVGRLAPEKRVELALEAFDRLRLEFPGAALVLVGDGPDRQALEARGIPGVRFAGYRTGNALAEAYAAGDLFVFPSDTETFGNVVAEALASGLPVVTVSRGGVTDTVIPGRNGLLCPPGDASALAEGIRTLLLDDTMRDRLAAGARASALDRSWKRSFDALFDGYEEARRPEPTNTAAGGGRRRGPPESRLPSDVRG